MVSARASRSRGTGIDPRLRQGHFWCTNTLSFICRHDMKTVCVLRIGTLTGSPQCRERHTLCRLKNPTVIQITVLSTSFGKTFFAWRFILNENILFWLTISYQKPFVFYVSVFYFQIFTQKLKLRPKVGLIYAIYSTVIFFEFLSKKIFFTFLCWIWIIDVLQQYCENFRKIEQMELVENLAPSYLPYRFLHDLALFLLWEKVKIFDFFKTYD